MYGHSSVRVLLTTHESDKPEVVWLHMEADFPDGTTVRYCALFDPAIFLKLGVLAWHNILLRCIEHRCIQPPDCEWRDEMNGGVSEDEANIWRPTGKLRAS